MEVAEGENGFAILTQHGLKARARTRNRAMHSVSLFCLLFTLSDCCLCVFVRICVGSFQRRDQEDMHMHTLRMLSIFKSHIRVTLRNVNVNTRVIPLRMRLCVQAGILDRIRDIT